MRPVDDTPPKTGNHWLTLKSLLPFLWAAGRTDLKVRVILAFVCLLAAKGLGVFMPFFLKGAVDSLTPTGGSVGAAGEPSILGAADISVAVVVPVALILAYGGARLFSLVFGELRDAVFVAVGQGAMRSLALKTFRHLHSLSLAYHLERRTGGLSRIIERGLRGIDFLLRFTLFNIIPTLLEIVLVTAIFWVNFGVLYALVAFISLAGYIAYTLVVTEWRLQFRRTMNKVDTEANTKAVDSLLNFETVKYFTSEEHEARRYDSALESYEKAAVKSQVSLSFLNIGQGAIIAGGLVIILLMSAYGVAEGRLTLGDFVLANSLLIQIYQPLNFLGFVYREIKHSLTDMEKMFDVLATHQGVEDKPGAEALRISAGRVAFEDVTFGYTPTRQILKGISFTVEGGKTTAVVGASGAGKSTLSRLLFRFYDVGGGSVRIDGQDIRTVTQASLRAAIGVVPQDTVLFNDTIAYNIAYGRPGATRAEVEDAARLAQLTPFIDALPEGYDTLVGERGLKVSGGEKQRIAIARTLLKNPPILMLDEATSALDSHTEREIQAALERISTGRTTLIIAHRLSTVVNADEILVLDAGQIVERGTHKALLAKGGVYAAMWLRQQEARSHAGEDAGPSGSGGSGGSGTGTETGSGMDANAKAGAGVPASTKASRP